MSSGSNGTNRIVHQLSLQDGGSGNKKQQQKLTKNTFGMRFSAPVSEDPLVAYARSLDLKALAYSDALIKGPLKKMSNSVQIYRKWNVRHCTLTHEFLAYQKQPTEFGNVGFIFLDKRSQVDFQQLPHQDGHSVQYTIYLTVTSSVSLDLDKSFQDRTYVFMADGKSDFDHWYTALRLVVYGPSGGASPIMQLKDNVINGISSSFISGNDGDGSGEKNNDGRIHDDAILSPHFRPKTARTLSSSSLNLRESFKNGIRRLSSSQQTGPTQSSANYGTPSLENDVQSNFRQESILRPVYTDACQKMENFIAILQQNVKLQDGPVLESLLDYTTGAIRIIRQLLYFADANILKTIQNPFLVQFITKNVSAVIEISRRVGFSAKKAHEDSGRRYRVLLKELLDIVEQLNSDMAIFVECCECAQDIDEAMGLKAKHEVFNQDVLLELMDLAVQTCSAISLHEKDSYYSLSESVLVLSRALIMSLQNHYPQLADSVKTSRHKVLSKWLLTLPEFTEIISVMDKHRGTVKHECELAADMWNSSHDFNLAAALLQLIVTMVRCIVTILLLNQSDLISDQFWSTFMMLRSNLDNQEKPKIIVSHLLDDNASNGESRQQQRSLSDLKIVEKAKLESPIHPILEDIEAAFLLSSQGSTADSVRETAYDVDDLNQRLQDFMKRSSASLDVPPSIFAGSSQHLQRTSQVVPARLQSTRADEVNNEGDMMAADFSVNQVVAKTIGELSALVLDAAAQMDPMLKTNIDEHVIDKLSYTSGTVTAACHQIEEELGALEGHFSSEDELTNNLDDARQSLSRSVFCFEISVKTLSSFYIPHDAGEQILCDLDLVVKSCGGVIEAVRSVLVHQAHLMNMVGNAIKSVNFDQSVVYVMPPTPPQSAGHRKRAPTVDSIAEEEQRLNAEAEKEVAIILEDEDEMFVQDPHILFRKSDDGQFDTTMIKAGTLEKLVEKLTYYRLPSGDYISAFLLTYRSFTNASTLLELLIRRYNVEPPLDIDDEKQRSFYFSRKIIPIRLRVFNVIKMWVKNNYEDFANDPMLLRSLYDFLPTMRSDFHRGVQEFEGLLDRRARGDNIVAVPKSFAAPPQSVVPRNMSIEVSITHLDPLEVARQLSLCQWDIFVRIQPNECLNQSWNVKALHHCSPNIRKMIQYSNFLVLWVSTEIVEGDTIKTRAAVIKHFIQIACQLKRLNNFDGLKSVICGMQSSAVRRLRKSWELIPAKFKASYEELETLMLEEKSCKNYRTVLHTVNPPCIPFLGVYLTDLTMIESGNADNLKDYNNLINFHKRHLIAQVILELKRYQGTPYSLIRVESIIQWIKRRPAHETEFIYSRSLAVEPRQ